MGKVPASDPDSCARVDESLDYDGLSLFHSPLAGATLHAMRLDSASRSQAVEWSFMSKSRFFGRSRTFLRFYASVGIGYRAQRENFAFDFLAVKRLDP